MYPMAVNSVPIPLVNFTLKAHPNLASWSWDIAADAQIWTPATYELFGLDPSEPPPSRANHTQFYTPESFSLLDAANQRCRETGEPYLLHLEGIHADGSIIHLEAHGGAERDEGGAIINLFGQFIDRSAETRARKALQEAGAKTEFANESRSRFLTNMGHEIRTPLNAIIGMAELLEYDSKRNDVKECLRTIHTSGDVLLSLVNDILDFSRIEAGQIDLSMAPVDIAQCVRESLTIISSTAAEKALEFDVLIDPELPRTIMADSLRIRQILLNLLMNAVKFTERGRVTLGLSCASNTAGEAIITFTVRDTGIGISEEEKQLLFKIFSQGDDSTSRRHGGTGLGLAFSQKLVENGLEVLDALHQGTFDLILMDIQMPLMNGLEATEAILQKYPEGERPQIVALTANATPEDRATCMAAGMIDYLTKPLRREQLARLLQDVHARLPVKTLRPSRQLMND